MGAPSFSSRSFMNSIVSSSNIIPNILTHICANNKCLDTVIFLSIDIELESGRISQEGFW